MVRGFMELLKWDSPTAEAFGQINRAFMRAIADDDVFRAVGDQVARCQLRHLACPDQIDGFPFQRTKNLLRQLHGH
jgi:hypothetical protein